MKNLLLICLLITGFVVKTPAQTKVTDEAEPHRITLRLNFLGALDPYDLHLPAGAEVRLNHRWAAGLDLGYFFYSEYLTDNEGTSGWLVRPFARRYSPNHANRFLEARIHFKNVGYRITDWIDRDIVNGVPSYQEYTTTTFRKQVLGLDIMNGRTLSLSRNERLNMEFYFGIGIRWKKQGVKNGRLSERGIGFINLFIREIVYPSFPAGARLTLAL